MNKQTLTNNKPLRFLMRCAVLITVLITFPMSMKAQPQTISSLADITDVTGSYILSSSFSTDGTARVGGNGDVIGTSTNPFKGTIDGQLVTITGTWDKPLFDYVEDATIKNVIIQSVGIDITTENTNVGAIAGNAKGETRIYNCGILGGSVSGTKYVGGLVGYLYDKESNKGSRVINCYSYANVGGGTDASGIVGYNKYASKASDIRTMVMNCMFYGSITAGTYRAPIYGGSNINNENSGGLSNFNYYFYGNLSSGITKYNCALALEEKYLNRIEFYRLLLNSNKKLTALYASTSAVTVDSSQMAKWVFEPADRTITGREPYPYPILKAQGYYPSIINPDFTNAPDSTAVGPNKGGKLGKTLSVTISAPSGWTNAPTNAKLLDADGNEITTSRKITLNRTDKDFDRFNFNYDKVQLPYYNDYGTKNYTDNKVVTGWKITTITPVANDPYTTANYDYTKSYSSTPAYFDYPNYNFANRKSSNKDLYSVSGRVFSQGAYFDVPYGVTSITIEPYWGKAAYLADQYMDVVYKEGKISNREAFIAENVTQLGEQFPNGKITIDGSQQTVHKTISAALTALSIGSTANVYDNAVVLVGNFHQGGVPSDGDKAFTMMSVDLDKDNEPDYSLIYWDNDRHTVSPLRFDFLNIPGAAQAQKPSSTGLLLNAAIFRTKGWFEITNTALMYFSQYEYENTGVATNQNMITKTNAPLILLGGYIDQFVSAQSAEVKGKTIYIHVGGNVLINSFGLGTHGDGSKKTPHVPVSVTGGDYLGFYLTGTYSPGAEIVDDNAECYISGGRFKELAGAAQEQIGANNSANNGNVHWQIYHADITDFYGGGYNDDKPVQGNITTDIFNSNVGTFCGGPKFGNMASGKKVTTNAKGCTFGKFFGAGYGGNSYSRKKYYDAAGTMNWANLEKYYYCPTCSGTNENERGKYYNGSSTNAPYGKKGPGVATDFDYEYFVWTKGTTGGRFYIKFASFSLAQCNDVESKLKNCVINENFYGGGELGTVIDIATSELDDCTVKGNVFGAGYSASLPKIPVRTEGFSSYPSFNKYSGMFEPGVLSATEDFEWMHKDNYPNNNSVGFLDDNGNYTMSGHNVVTKVVIDNTNLGSVQTVSLTLKGNTIVGDGSTGTGNVFGGGQMSAVKGNAVVKLQGNTQVKGNVFGGGDQGNVVGNTTIQLQESTNVQGNVYGGGNEGPVSGNSEVIIKDN